LVLKSPHCHQSKKSKKMNRMRNADEKRQKKIKGRERSKNKNN
jgi:hypothetical protein